MANDSTILLILGAAVAALALAMETLARRRLFPQWLCRKVLHVGAVGACAAAPLLLSDLGALTTIVAGAAVLLYGLVRSGVLFREADGRPSWGIALFPVPYLVLLLLFRDADERWLVALPMLILAVSDALAAVVGTLVRTRSFTLTGDRKTVGGSLSFALSTWVILVSAPGPMSALSATPLPMTAALFALILAAVEALGSQGRDNLYIPSAAALLLAGQPTGTLPALLAVPVAVLFVAITVRRGWLTLGGGVAAALLGIWVIVFQGIPWLLPLVAFLVSSTLLGKLLRARSASGDAKQGQPRDAAQVFANGGIYGIAAALLPQTEAQLVMALCMSAAAADTWASECGIARKGRTYDVIGLRPVPVGLSGGISLGGTLGAAAGALLLAALGATLIRGWQSPGATIGLVATLTGLGLAGMLIDSVLGSLLQAKYRGPSGALQDSEADGAGLVGGWRWMSNDAVNLVTSLLIAGIGLMMLA